MAGASAALLAVEPGPWSASAPCKRALRGASCGAMKEMFGKDQLGHGRPRAGLAHAPLQQALRWLSLGCSHCRVAGVREAEAGAPAITQLSTVIMPTCGSDGARQSRVQQPQQLGAPTVDATECGC